MNCILLPNYLILLDHMFPSLHIGIPHFPLNLYNIGCHNPRHHHSGPTDLNWMDWVGVVLVDRLGESGHQGVDGRGELEGGRREVGGWRGED